MDENNQNLDATNLGNSEKIEKVSLTFSLLAVDPKHLRGIILRGRAGPVKNDVYSLCRRIFSKKTFHKIHPSITDQDLYGGIDLPSTLEAGRLIKSTGLLKGNNSVFFLCMAERLNSMLIAKFCTAIDRNNSLCFLASDEGVDEERISTAILDRLAFFVDLESLRFSDTEKFIIQGEKINAAKNLLNVIEIPEDIFVTMTKLSFQLGIDSVRAPLLAAYCARALAAFNGNVSITQEDILKSIELVLGHRAIVLPAPEETNEEIKHQDMPEKKEEGDAKGKENTIPPELILEAVRSSISTDILKNLHSRKSVSRLTSSSSGSGQKKISNRRGRPIPSRPGKLDSTKRIDIIETLRTAAPWQNLRSSSSMVQTKKIHIRSEDLRLKRNEEKSDRLIIFAVDASGSSALGRLAETKGAIEILLSEAYARRDQVALISFRGTGSEILLPPTRSLVRTRKCLASLPGGGGTPLASGIKKGLELAEQAQKKGLSPAIAFLTDGKGNINLKGEPSREESANEAENYSKMICAKKIPSLVIDISNRPQEPAKTLASMLQATYIALPRANSRSLSSTIFKALD